MKPIFDAVPLRWRVFLATSITITVLFAVAGWVLQQYAISVADESVRAEIRVSIQAYEAVWKARTQTLSATTALMGAMSDVRAAFQTGDPQTIRDSAHELWSRVSTESAIFLVLDPEGHLISSLGGNSEDLPVSAIPLRQVSSRFPRQLAGYLRDGQKLFYLVLTPVYVQTSNEPVLLNVLCAGFHIDNRVVNELKSLAPGSDFAFVSRDGVFSSTLDPALNRQLCANLRTLETSKSERIWQDRFVIFRQPLDDAAGQPVADLCILHSYTHVQTSLAKLRRIVGIAWLLTIATALLVSSYTTRRLLEPVKLLDRAASEIASRNYHYRVPVKGAGELSRLAETFNNMCDSIEQAQADLIRQEQIHTIGRLGTSLVHDLRNPLAAIYGGAEMLVDGQLPPEHTRRIASNIYRASQKMQELLRDLLDVSHGEARNAEFCRLREIVEAAAESVNRANLDVNIRIQLNESAEVFCDRTRVERVFVNLLSNAIEAMPDGGVVEISLREEPGSLVVFVEDTGPGIPSNIKSKIFRPFVTGKRYGLGLGLALSRQTMVDLGGDLAVAESAGNGACFSVRFPKAPAHEPAMRA